MTPDCSNHRKDVFGEHDMKKLAIEIGDLHYEALAELLDELSDKLISDAAKDRAGNRDRLAKCLEFAAEDIMHAGISIERAYDICKQFMDNKKQK